MNNCISDSDLTGRLCCCVLWLYPSQALSNGRYKSCLHRAVVNRRQERRSLAFFLCPREDRVVRPPASGDVTVAPRRYPDFTWADLMRFTQRHYRADTRTLDAFTRWLAHAPAQEAAAAP